MNVNIKDCNTDPYEISRKRAIDDVLTTYHSDCFTNVKNNTLRTIDVLFKLGYYRDSESLFTER